MMIESISNHVVKKHLITPHQIDQPQDRHIVHKNVSKAVFHALNVKIRYQ